MLTDEAVSNKWWGHLPALSPLLEEHLRALHEKNSSIEESAIERLSRNLSYGLLVHAARAAILNRASYIRPDTSREMANELGKIEGLLSTAASHIHEQLETIAGLRQRLASDNIRTSNAVITRLALRAKTLLDELDAEEAMIWRRDLGQLAESQGLVRDQSLIDFSNNDRFVASLITENLLLPDWLDLKLEHFRDPDTIEDVSELHSALGC